MAYGLVVLTLILELLLVIVPALVFNTVKKSGCLLGLAAFVVMLLINMCWQSLTGLGVISVLIQEFVSYNFA